MPWRGSLRRDMHKAPVIEDVRSGVCENIQANGRVASMVQVPPIVRQDKHVGAVAWMPALFFFCLCTGKVFVIWI
jgi:hypothetical protein